MNRLKLKLKQGVTYCARYFVVNRNVSSLGIADYGILFAGTEIDTITQCRIPLPYLTPQITYTGGIISDTLYWTAVSGTFTAAGHEKYLVLGNFKSNAATQTAVINSSSLPQLYCDPYIDDVSLVEMELPAFAGNDTSIWVGDSAFIGREPDVGLDYACQWFQLPNDSVPIDTVAGLWVKPNAPTTYVLKQQLWCNGVKWDTVTIHFATVGIGENPFTQTEIFPNPATNLVTIRTVSNISYTFSISDVAGRVLKTGHSFPGSRENTICFDFKPGSYFITLDAAGQRLTKKLIVSN